MATHEFIITVDVPDDDANATDAEWWADAAHGALTEYGAETTWRLVDPPVPDTARRAFIKAQHEYLLQRLGIAFADRDQREHFIDTVTTNLLVAIDGSADTSTADAVTALSPEQRAHIHHYNGYGVPITWFVGPTRDNGDVEVIGLGNGDDEGNGRFVWALLLSADGSECHTSEAECGPFETGLTI